MGILLIILFITMINIIKILIDIKEDINFQRDEYHKYDGRKDDIIITSIKGSLILAGSFLLMIIAHYLPVLFDKSLIHIICKLFYITALALICFTCIYTYQDIERFKK